MMNWRAIYLSLVALRFFFGVSDSYIHPDEHFQLMELLTNRLLGYNTTEAWEFSSGARSLVPLYLCYGPLVWLNRWMDLTPIQLWYAVRLVQVVVLWMVIDWCIYKMMPTRPERVKGIMFVATLYVTLAHQSHLFSNCVELVLLMVAVYIINELRVDAESRQWGNQVVLAVVVALGVFTRITFGAFLLLPGWFVVNHWWRHWSLAAISLVVFLAVLAAIIAGDSHLYGEWTIAPWNNFLYNLNVDNLAAHGLHPWWTHTVVNFPQLLGPGLVFMWGSRYKQTVPFLAIVLGIFVLSFFPHQEARFLIPAVPLACCCFNLELGWITPWLINAWYVFNVAMSVLMGVFHQGGVVPALDHLRQQPPQTQVWWRTYSPPTWMLADNGTYEYSRDYSSVLAPVVVDCMGMDVSEVVALIDKYKPVNLVMPLASLPAIRDKINGNITEVWSYRYHYDMDHFDVGDLSSFVPGLAIYNVI